MKFTNGFWLMQDDIKAYFPIEIVDATMEDNSLTIYAISKKIRSRSDMLDGPMFTIKFSSPMEDIIKVNISHFQGGVERGPKFELNEDDKNPVKISEDEDFYFISSGELTAKISKNQWDIKFLHGEKFLVGSSSKNIGYILRDNKETYVHEQLSLGVGETVYGLGERFSPFVKNGQVINVWNKDGGTGSEQAYKNIPFYITNRGYGVYVNHPEGVAFEIGSEKVSRVQFSVPGEELEYYVILGPEPKSVLNKYTKLTGTPALPPAWSFGLWLTTSFTTNYDEETVMKFINGMSERNIPLSVFHFDCFWMKEYEWCNFKWNSDFFEDPEAIINKLKDRGLKICLWINPYIGQKSQLFKEGKEKGYFIKKPNEDVWQWDLWQPGLAIVDFTNPAAYNWYKDKLRGLLESGVDCFKTDFGERIPTRVVYHDGSDPIKMHNYYTYLYNKAVFEVLEEKYGRNNSLVFARSATVGCQKFPVHWGGDCNATYESMAESLRGGLSLGVSGFGFWSHDISGFENTATADLYKRWVAFGLLSTHSRLHGNSSYRVPWNFDDEAVEVLRDFVQLKCKLMPYIFAKACEASNKGIPVMRAMFLEFTEDPTCDFLDRQYMMGDSLMVCPIFNKEGIVPYYLPAGEWTNFITGKVIEGERWVKEKYDYFGLPLMVRENTVLAIGNNKEKTDYDYTDNVTFHIFQLNKEAKIQSTVNNINGETALTINVERNNDKIKVKANGAKNRWNILLRNVFEVKEVLGGEAEVNELGTLIITNALVEEIHITL